MKNTKRVSLVAIGLASILSVAQADDAFKMGGYFRSGVGQSGGRERVCVSDGTSGNQFRLGNECGTYMETNFNYGIGAPKYDNSTARAHITFAYTDTPNRTQYESTKSNVMNVQLVESYADVIADNVTYWAGKRFYRWGDIHMDDFYYFAVANGSGAGLESIKTSYGTWSAALLQETSTTASTNDGNLSESSLDLRLAGVKVTDSTDADIWLANSYNAGGYTGTTSYKSFSGTALGVRFNTKLEDWQNAFALLYGSGAAQLDGLSVSAVISGSDTASGKTTARLVESLLYKGSRWDVDGTLIYQETNIGPDSKTTTKWSSMGVRPTYYFSDIYSVTGQVGRSAVKVDSGTDNYLVRSTLAFQIQPKTGFFTRPSLRFYITNNDWNNDNATVKAGSTVLANKTNYVALGTQAEVWF